MQDRLEPNHQPTPRPHPQPAWEAALLKALNDPVIVTQHGDSAHIDCSLLERVLSANTTSLFMPARSSAVADRLKELGVFVISNQAPSSAELIRSPGRYIGQYLGETTVDFYNGVFSNPHAAMYLAPTLLGSLIYSNNRELSTHEMTRKGGILSVLREDFLSSAAMSGMFGELRRNLLLRYVHSSSADPDRFINYANGLPASENDNHRPFFIEHARLAITQVLTEKRELPGEMIKLLQDSCGIRLFHNFRYSTITPWLESKLSEITRDFDYCHRLYDRIVASPRTTTENPDQNSKWDDALTIGPYADPSDEFEALEEELLKITERFSACLDLMLYADDGCVHFHREHVQDAETGEQDQNSEESAELPLDSEPPPNSKLLQSLTRCTSSMLGALGRPGIYAPLDIKIPDNIAQLQRGRFQWYPDDYEAFETFYRKDVAECLVRFIENLDFQSACALIIIAPTTTNQNGALTLPLEIEGPIIENQDLICRKIAEKADNISGSIRSSSTLLGWQHIHDEVQELKRAITTFLQPVIREFGSNELSRSLSTLVALLALRGHHDPEPSSTHRGFEMVLDILQQFGSPGSSYVGQLFASVLSSSPEIKATFSQYISDCNVLAQELLVDREKRPHRLSDYERHLLVPTRLYRLLPSSFRSEGIASPTDCSFALKTLHRGRTLRDRISTLESGSEFQPREAGPYDVLQHIAIFREANSRQSHGDSSLPLATSRSLVRLLKRGAISVDPEVQSLIGEADRVIATAIIPQLRQLHEPENRKSLVSEIFSAESNVISSFLIALRSNNPTNVIRSSDVAAEFYEVASDRIKSHDMGLSNSMSKLSKTFSKLSESVRELKLAEHGPLSKKDQHKLLKILKDFVEHESIQKLIEDLHISA